MFLEGIDFDTVITNKVRFAKTVDGAPREWWLVDNVGTEVGLQIAQLLKRTYLRSQQPLPQNDPVAMIDLLERAYAETVDDTLSVFMMIWGLSYPDDTMEQVRHWWTHEQREEIIRYFFTRRSQPSSTPSSDSTSASPNRNNHNGPRGLTPPPNRSPRRKTSKTSPAGTPSQKRLLRQLQAS